MDTPPNFFGEAAGLEPSDLVGDTSFDGAQGVGAVGLPAYLPQQAVLPGAAPSNGVPSAWVHPPLGPNVNGLHGAQYAPSTKGRPSLDAGKRGSISASVSTAKSTTRTNSESSAHTRRSVSSKSTAPPAEPQPSKRKKGKRAVKAETPEIEPVPPTKPTEQKRDKFLERNRVAASKCRQRKKEWMTDLQETKNSLEAQNLQLQAEHHGLVSEISDMKTQLMNHAECNDPNISLWIENEARRFVESEAGRLSISQVMKGNTMPSGPPPNAPRVRASIDGPSPHLSPLAMDPSLSRVVPRTESTSTGINYDHMPDEMFETTSGPGPVG